MTDTHLRWARWTAAGSDLEEGVTLTFARNRLTHTFALRLTDATELQAALGTLLDAAKDRRAAPPSDQDLPA